MTNPGEPSGGPGFPPAGPGHVPPGYGPPVAGLRGRRATGRRRVPFRPGYGPHPVRAGLRRRRMVRQPHRR